MRKPMELHRWMPQTKVESTDADQPYIRYASQDRGKIPLLQVISFKGYCWYLVLCNPTLTFPISLNRQEGKEHEISQPQRFRLLPLTKGEVGRGFRRLSDTVHWPLRPIAFQYGYHDHSYSGRTCSEGCSLGSSSDGTPRLSRTL